MHVRRAIALARKAVAETEERALVASDERRELFDLLDRKPGDLARPFWRSRLQVRFEASGSSA